LTVHITTAAIVRWLLEPDSRDFDHQQLILITAMTGNEFDDTIELSSRFILPMLADAGVRLVQVARAGLHQHDGIIVLDDAVTPEQLHPRGPVALSDELLLAGTVATQANGMRRCSVDCTNQC
jgi:hypothetical protein